MASHHPRPTESMLVFDSMRIRTKLAVALVIPLLALLGLSAVAISASNQKADERPPERRTINDQVDLATASLGPSGVITALQGERNGEAVDLIGVTDWPSAGGQTPRTCRAADDAAIAQFKAAIASRSAAVQEAYQPAIDAMDTIAAAADRDRRLLGPPHPRRAATRSSSTRSTQYTEIANAVFDGNSSVATRRSTTPTCAPAPPTSTSSAATTRPRPSCSPRSPTSGDQSPGGLTGDLDAFATCRRAQRRGRVPQGRHGPQHRRPVLPGPRRPRPSPTPT